ncbi:collectrin, amino acid transport regulator L homeolog precursor [Xenopus laevis]|uniref:Collectrin, amino acid transport regulator L homeolog precursor n=1 Tax=Xenopus laevis TaxID=8355 RepID=Q6PE94_XENLA|nr:collectrin, amino acid transport regulator L homeolog precursor [Xenopus laevis]AAH58203.1 MGC68634 protein [Xenopus laevis]
MLGGILLFLLSLPTFVHGDLCEPGSRGALKVRLNIKAALGDNAYTWNSDEEYLFKAVMAFVMRSYTKNDTFQISNIVLCNSTERVSFWFVVTSPSNESHPVSYSVVEAAVRNERNRINSAFLLNDKTLEFVQIPPTLAPASQSSSSSWLIVFGVVVFVVSVAIAYLVVSGVIRHRKRLKSSEEESQNSEARMKSLDAIKNGGLHDKTILTDSLVNDSYDYTGDAYTAF